MVKHPGFEPHSQLSSQVWTRIDFGQKRILINSIETFFDVCVQDILVLFGDGIENRLNRIVTGATWSEAIAVGFKARFPFGFKRQLDQRLAGSVGHGGNAQWPLFARLACFGYPDPAHGMGLTIEAKGPCQLQAFRGR